MGESGLNGDVIPGTESSLRPGIVDFGQASVVAWQIVLVNNDYQYKYWPGNIVYFFYTVFLVIIMLNLLIAIISNTYDRVNNTRKGTDYKIKAQQLVLLSQAYQLTWFKLAKFMFTTHMVLIVFVPIIAVIAALKWALIIIFYPFKMILEVFGCMQGDEKNSSSSYVL